MEFAEVNLSKDPAGRVGAGTEDRDDELPAGDRRRRLLGGFAELQAAADSGRLEELLAA